MAASEHPFGGPGAHNGGRVRFNSGDGILYLTTGDNHNSEVPQSPTMMGSKVLRIDTDGNAAPENAPPEGFDARTYTYGHRNVQGIAFHPESNTPIVAEHGPWHSNEITVLQNRGNAGWDPRPNMVIGVMGIGFSGTPIGQRIDVIELAEDGMSVVDVTEMTLPTDSGRFRSLVLGPDGSLYAAVDEGMIHKLAP